MTSSKSFYDVIVVGASLGSLAAGALLARRGFRVAYIRHDSRPNSYQHEGATFLRAPEAIDFIDSPAFRRVLSELSLTPIVRRKLTVPHPLYQVTLPNHRIDVPANAEALLTELSREFPEVRRPMEEFYATVDRATAETDALVSADIIWPPERFFERREAARAATGSWVGQRSVPRDPLEDFPAEHPFRTFIAAQSRFASALDPDEISPMRLLRAHGASIRGATFLEGGRDALAKLLEDKIVQHGGELRSRDRVARIVVQRGRIQGVDLTTTDERLGCTFVVTPLNARSALHLAEHYPSRSDAERIQARIPRYYRFILNVVVHAGGIPSGMAQRVFGVIDRARPLAEENLLAIEQGAADATGRIRLTVATLLPRSGVEEGDGYLRRQRERILSALEEIVPFVGRNAIYIDSPHDGRPLQNKVDGTEIPVEDRWDAEAETMAVVESPDTASFLGVCAVPGRTELKGLLLVGRQVVPGLGEEGELLAALSAARIITRTDRTKERLRRELWSKVEA